MPVPSDQLRAAIATLSDIQLQAMARHSGVSPAQPREELVQWLGSDTGTRLISYSHQLPHEALARVANVFGIAGEGLSADQLRGRVFAFISNYDRQREREQLHRQLGVPLLSEEFLWNEVQKLARPCVYLTGDPTDGPFAGAWQGPGVVPLESPGWTYWLSFDCSILPVEFAPYRLQDDVVSIYFYDDPNLQIGEFAEGGVVRDANCVFEQSPEPAIRIGGRTLHPGRTCGEALYARRGESFPSWPQTLANPTPGLRDWLTKMDYSFESGDYNSLAARELRDVYVEELNGRLPIWTDRKIAAVVGGWGIDVEFAYVAGIGPHHQLVFTLWEAEPFVQAVIHRDTGQFHVRQIIT